VEVDPEVEGEVAGPYLRYSITPVALTVENQAKMAEKLLGKANFAATFLRPLAPPPFSVLLVPPPTFRAPLPPLVSLQERGGREGRDLKLPPPPPLHTPLNHQGCIDRALSIPKPKLRSKF
jgi:hypothetical protein